MFFSVSAWMIYTMWAIFALMAVDFLIALFRSFWEGSFNTTFLGYLKDILYYVIPLNVVASMSSIAFSFISWFFIGIYFVGGLSVIIKYVLDIKRRFTS